MKVLLAGYILGRGGIQSHLRWLARALVESGVETLALVMGDEAPTADSQASLQYLQELGVQLAFCTPYSRKGTRLDLSRLRRFQEVIAVVNQFQPDIYLAVGTGWNLPVPALLARSRSRRVFHEVMSGIPNGWRDARWGVRLWFDEVVGQSPTVAHTFAQCFKWPKPVPALPALPEPLEITAQLPQVTAKTIPRGQIRAAMFSRLEPYKRGLWLVQKWEHLQPYLAELHIYGTGVEEAAIRAWIEQQGLGDRVFCHGRYPDGQAYVDLLSQYDLTLLPTIGAEGAPLVLLESMACGVPFVACNVGGIPDYGVNNPDCLVVETSTAAFLAGVEQMAERLSQGQIDQVRLQQLYLNLYSYQVLKQKWLTYLTNLLPQSAAAA